MGTASVLAITQPQPQTAGAPLAPAGLFQTVGFNDRPEADMLHRAYRMLAHGDHDYKGHRIAAMKQVKAAADLLGVDLSGDDKDREQQALSDDKLRETRDLLAHVLEAAEVKGQPRVAKHINAAINQIDVALSVR